MHNSAFYKFYQRTDLCWVLCVAGQLFLFCPYNFDLALKLTFAYTGISESRQTVKQVQKHFIEMLKDVGMAVSKIRCWHTTVTPCENPPYIFCLYIWGYTWYYCCIPSFTVLLHIYSPDFWHCSQIFQHQTMKCCIYFNNDCNCVKIVMSDFWDCSYIFQQN